FLLLQATEMNLFGHLMAGFSKEALMDFLHIEAPFDPITVLALGYLNTADALEEPYKTREITPRIRKSIDEITQWPKGKQLA
nr:nitroreductase [Cytophagaceae bacterium]